MWHDVWAVIRREYLQRVRSKWFIGATVGAPIIMAGLVLVPAYMANQGDEMSRSVAIVDGTDVLYQRLAPMMEDGGWEVEEARWHAEVSTELRDRVAAGEIGGFIMLDELTLETGEAIYFTLERPSPIRQASLRAMVARSALEFQLEQRGVDAQSMLQGGDLRVEMLSDRGAGSDEPRFMVAYFGAFTLYMVILLYAVAVMRATLEEKTSRIVEVIISSMDPWHLMLGKILGVGAVSLTQMAIWLAIGGLLFASGVPMLISARPELTELAELGDVMPGVGMLLLFVGFFVFGFFMYSSLYAAVGAMCNSDEEAQQAQFPIVMLLVVPIIMVMNVIQNPMSPTSVALSFFPLFTPILMWGRVAGGGAPGWQVALSFVLMFVTVIAIAWIAGRIYKVGILMAGKRPTLPELWRWVREA